MSYDDLSDLEWERMLDEDEQTDELRDDFDHDAADEHDEYMDTYGHAEHDWQE